MKLAVLLSLLLVLAITLHSQNPSVAPNSAEQNPDSASPSGEAATTTKNSDLDRLQTFATQADQIVVGLHADKWKASPEAKSAAQANADAVHRNVTTALPGLIDAARANPEDVNAGFKLYRNVNALYEVFSTVTESTRIFGQKGQYEALSGQLQTLGSIRRKMGQSLEELTASVETERKELRAELKVEQQKVVVAESAAAEARKQVMLAQAEISKKPPAKKKAIPKKPTSSTTSANPASAAPNASGQAATSATAPK